MYEGDWINDKPEGNGKYIYENGEYYLGQYKNGKRHGKGKKYEIYNNERKLVYEGEYLNGIKHGKGKMYYSNGNIQYEGDWINNKREGNGKYIWENGEYYIGQFNIAI